MTDTMYSLETLSGRGLLDELDARDIVDVCRWVARANRNKHADTIIVGVTDNRAEFKAWSGTAWGRKEPGQFTLGQCSYFTRVVDGQVRPASCIWIKADYPDATEDVVTTLIHEACHSLTGRTQSHNYSWRRLMTKAWAAWTQPTEEALRHFARNLVLRYTRPKNTWSDYETQDEYFERVEKEASDLVRRGLQAMPQFARYSPNS